MELTRRAVIDVGTNSVKLLVAEVAGRDVSPVHEESRQTRLGKDFYDTHVLQPEAIARTAEAVAQLAGRARGHHAVSLRVIATSAARDAKNPGELAAAIRTAAGLETEIISGEQEARWAFQGIVTDPRLAESAILILDVGGGSTEFILGTGRTPILARSVPLGTVRLLEKFPHADPPTAADFTTCRDWLLAFLRERVRPELEPGLGGLTGPVQFVGTGGTASLLARMELKLNEFDRTAMESVRLDLPRIKALRQHLWSLPLAQREAVAGLPRNRADVILTGVIIYEAVMDVLGLNELGISTRGLRFAALMDD